MRACDFSVSGPGSHHPLIGMCGKSGQPSGGGMTKPGVRGTEVMIGPGNRLASFPDYL